MLGVDDGQRDLYEEGFAAGVDSIRSRLALYAALEEKVRDLIPQIRPWRALGFADPPVAARAFKSIEELDKALSALGAPKKGRGERMSDLSESLSKCQRCNGVCCDTLRTRLARLEGALDRIELRTAACSGQPGWDVCKIAREALSSGEGKDKVDNGADPRGGSLPLPQAKCEAVGMGSTPTAPTNPPTAEGGEGFEECWLAERVLPNGNLAAEYLVSGSPGVPSHATKDPWKATRFKDRNACLMACTGTYNEMQVGKMIPVAHGFESERRRGGAPESREGRGE